jgi:hypothetical protein
MLRTRYSEPTLLFAVLDDRRIAQTLMSGLPREVQSLQQPRLPLCPHP